MKLRHKVYALVLVIPATLACVIVLAGTIVINSILWDLHEELLSVEIDYVGKAVEAKAQVLERAGVAGLPSYAADAQQQLINSIRDNTLKVSGQLFVLAADGSVIYHPGFAEGPIPDSPFPQEMLQSPKGVCNFDVNGQPQFCVFQANGRWNWIIGLSILKWAKFFGAADVGISEMVPARQARARRAGADLVIDASTDPDPVAEFERVTGRRPTVIFECVGRPLLHRLIEMAPPGAQLVLVGTGMQEERFTVLSAAMKRLRMTFTLGYEPGDFDFVLRMLGSGRISVDPLVTATVGLDEAPAMFAQLGQPNEHCKVLITPNA